MCGFRSMRRSEFSPFPPFPSFHPFPLPPPLRLPFFLGDLIIGSFFFLGSDGVVCEEWGSRFR